MHRRKFFKAAASVAFVTGVGGVTAALAHGDGTRTTLTTTQILAFEQASGLQFVPQPGTSFVPAACEIRTCTADIDIMAVLGDAVELDLADPVFGC